MTTTCTICETPLTPENTDKHPDTLGNLWCIPCVETPDIDWHAVVATTAKLTVEFNDIEYRMSHGTTPKGRGAWAFSTSRNAGPDDDIIWAPKARGITGCHGIYVQP